MDDCECGLLAIYFSYIPGKPHRFEKTSPVTLEPKRKKSPAQIDVDPQSSPPCGYVIAAAKTLRERACPGEPGVLNGPDR